jgi:hypothetical protein
MRLTLAFIRPTLATRSGDAPRIGIHSPDVGNTLGDCASQWHLYVQRWQHARGLRLALVFICPTLATRSGDVPRIGIYSPDVGNTLGGCASHWLSYIHPTLAIRSGVAPRIGILIFTRRWQHARGLRLHANLSIHSFYPALATCSGAAPYAVNLNSLQRCQLHPFAMSTPTRHILARHQ